MKWIKKLPKEARGFFINGTMGDIKAKAIVSIGNSLHISVADYPTKKQRENCEKLLGVKWTILEEMCEKQERMEKEKEYKPKGHIKNNQQLMSYIRMFGDTCSNIGEEYDSLHSEKRRINIERNDKLFKEIQHYLVD